MCCKVACWSNISNQKRRASEIAREQARQPAKKREREMRVNERGTLVSSLLEVQLHWQITTQTHTEWEMERDVASRVSHTPDFMAMWLWFIAQTLAHTLTHTHKYSHFQWQFNTIIFFSFCFFKIFNYIDIDKFIMCLATI